MHPTPSPEPCGQVLQMPRILYFSKTGIGRQEDGIPIGLGTFPWSLSLKEVKWGTIPPVPSLSLLTQHSQDILQAADLHQPGEAAQGGLRYCGSIVDQALGLVKPGDQRHPSTSLPMVHR